jgi:GNAT superfamily N-acetyltransferase
MHRERHREIPGVTATPERRGLTTSTAAGPGAFVCCASPEATSNGAFVPAISSTSEDPPSPLARAVDARAVPIVCITVHPRDETTRATLQAWLDAIPVLGRRELSAPTRARLADSAAICAELARVLDGTEAGEGRAAERTLHVVTARGRVHGICSMFACPRGTFVELLVTAPWNVLGAEDPSDPRTVRGAGTALVAAASSWSERRGCGGAVALQAATLRAAAFYERLGFRPMGSDDQPLSLVPPGEGGWSASILRLARGRPDAEERRSPWMLLEPSRARATPADGVPIPATG